MCSTCQVSDDVFVPVAVKASASLVLMQMKYRER